MITMALSKGRQLKDFIQYLDKKDLTNWSAALKSISRELVIETDSIRFLLVKGEDVPVYVEEGVADLGITGSDVLFEQNRQINNLIDLPFGYCHFAIAAKKNQETYPVVATKYINFTQNYFDSVKQPVKIIQLKGSVELAATIDMADAIMDIVQTGTTLKENGLSEQVKLDEINARLISNKHAYFAKNDEIQTIINQLRMD
ncbi:ATP phosphoribosyltransferase [Marinilactibacillus psychrotolerans]|uniref:ATP phosphoribosyltransferase n=2 Tax=Marinilactibacillus psychrotolerans TaxID=191770 RepID=A0A511H3M1_9LACT|nr:ATP phosphoribosyltransferase [Marinilactibacillus psychrotolerans]TLQ06580.1 ATP phosphoribosyltransferase [Marinilactibacillus psychrotolerans]SDD37470.1 ATP phosphoribosyltransferase [Marinilactibacillus psychrotolerans]SJN24921.1 ATP phosphoribosyltransferase [Marinilactibacillus psychrotolerans 42ea]GEL68128.1 ATP phosphoribosyltransferase [Marinilactibacillus psychrotolerans]GEQ33209.1 ATP phosphoribosyltransferase [Marinilactibacillus psychrotolerans]